MTQLTIVTILLSLFITWGSCDNHPPGHMQPLGSHMPPIPLDVLDTYPEPLPFYSNYVKRNWPVKLEGLFKTVDAVKNWQNDEYLR